MAMEKRGCQHYYYRKHRIGKAVVSEYVGGGAMAELAAVFDKQRQEQEELRRRHEKTAREADQAIDRELDELARLVRLIRDATLLTSGYHLHRGQWRERRDRYN
jgi:hypothetical protein